MRPTRSTVKNREGEGEGDGDEWFARAVDDDSGGGHSRWRDLETEPDRSRRIKQFITRVKFRRKELFPPKLPCIAKTGPPPPSPPSPIRALSFIPDSDTCEVIVERKSAGMVGKK